MSKIKEMALRYALQNAVFYNGKANPAAVLGKVLADRPEMRQKIQAVRREIEEAVREVNGLGLEKQRGMLKGLSPKMLVKPEKQQPDLPDLPKAVTGKFVTRFAPSPTGPLNIGQLLRAAMVPYMYARKYRGQFILRIEDTDPKNTEKAFYGMIMEDLLSSGVRWDKLVKESDHMPLYHKHAEQLISSGKAYVCTCKADEFRQLKLRKASCRCRKKQGKENLKDWKAMLTGVYKEGDAVVRLRTSMSDPNPAMRDPPLLRIASASHPLLGKAHRVWPLYNFACAVMDHGLGITHVFRGKEHEHNTAVQARIYGALGWTSPVVINFGMVYLPGTKIHTRDMRQWVLEKKVTGWDDPRLPTVRALLRRGFQSQTLKRFALTCGLSKTDIRIGWENLEGINRKLIDSLANRYMVVIDPVRISVKHAPAIRLAHQDLHPDFPARGKKVMPVDLNRVYVSRDDWKRLQGKTIRLKCMGNIALGKASEYKGNEIVAGMPKIQWVSEPNVAVELLTPKGACSCLGEPNLRKLKHGTLVQLERVGFGRIDSVSRNKVVIVFSHK
jgi:glutamyl-tRNA synthetase